jgi:uncharacterized membrane protein YhhN
MGNYGLLFLVPFFVLLPVYLHIRRQERLKEATVLKLTLSGLCTLCALLGFMLWGVRVDPSRILIVAALACAFVGDYFLLFIQTDEKKLKIGIVCFALTQILLIVFLCRGHGVSWPEFALTAAVIACVQLLVKAQKWELGRAKVFLSIYLLMVSFMVSKALVALFVSGTVTVLMCLMATGAVLFLLSDLRLGKNNFQADKNTRSALHLVLYFCGILLIALGCWY